jgi:long-subunit acyl-CoA synthetase (AMP-forming)
MFHTEMDRTHGKVDRSRTDPVKHSSDISRNTLHLNAIGHQNGKQSYEAHECVCALFITTHLLIHTQGQEKPADIIAGYPNEIATLMYTSGSTGLPKGTIVFNKTQNSELSGRSVFLSPLVMVSYMPLAHAMQRSSSYVCLAGGGHTGIFQGVATFFSHSLTHTHSHTAAHSHTRTLKLAHTHSHSHTHLPSLTFSLLPSRSNVFLFSGYHRVV